MKRYAQNVRTLFIRQKIRFLKPYRIGFKPFTVLTTYMERNDKEQITFSEKLLGTKKEKY